MRVIQDGPLENPNAIMVLIGDGSYELKTLPHIFRKYERDDIDIWCPWKYPLNPGAGFSVLNKIRFYSRFHKYFLFVADYEHLTDEGTTSTLHKKCKGILKNISTISKMEPLDNESHQNSYSMMIQCETIHQEVFIFSTILGRNFAIEECLSCLIKKEQGISVSPTKAIHQDIKRKNIKLNHILRGMKRENIQKCFPGLDSILCYIEKEWDI